MKFLSLSDIEKQQIMKLNDYWSNNWFYNRSLDTIPEMYRPLNEWEAMIEVGRMKIIKKGIVGFNNSRLHGVPSAWLIAQKIE